jgi:lysophospholipase L1-like esterase
MRSLKMRLGSMGKTLRWGLLGAIALFLTVPQARATDGTVFRLVVLGSSTAAGEAARPLDSSWVNKYRNYLGTVFQNYQVVNLAVGGFTTFNVMPNGYVRPAPYDADATLAVNANNNITKALSLNPSLILINLPTNDCDKYIPVNQQLANFDVLVQAALNQGVPVYLSTTQPRNSVQAVRSLLIQMYSEITNRYAGRVMDFWTGLAQADGTIKPAYDYDGTHLNNDGHTVLFQRAVAAINLPLPVTISPTQIGFGNRQTGVGTSLDVTVSNPSSSTLSFDNIYTGTSAFVPNRTSASASPGGSFTVQVTFTPTVIGGYSDTLYLHNNSSLVMVKVPLNGTAPAPALQALPASLSFGDVAKNVGASLRLVLRNSDLNAGSVTSYSSQSGRFSITPGTGTIGRNDSLVLMVNFTPTAFGSVSDTLRFMGVVAGGVAKVPVTGHSSIPVVTPSAAQLDFGDISMAAPKTMDVTLTNGSVNELVIDAIANSHAEYFVDPSSGTIAGNGSLVLHVTFAPAHFGTVSDTIQIISNASGSPLRIPLRGRVPVPGLSLSRTVITFPLIGQGENVVRYLYIRNAGQSPITVQSIGGHSPQFASATAMPLMVSAQDSALVGIRFAPNAAGEMRDTMSITTDAGSAELIVIGTSPLSYLRCQPTPVAFGDGKVGTTIWRSCVLKVQSTDPGFSIGVDSVRVQGGTFGVIPLNSRTVLLPADSLKLMLSFSPVLYKTYAETLLVYNDSYVGILRVPLSGTGDTFTDVGAAVDRTPEGFALHQNYPNPFNPTTEITFALSVPARTTLCVYDLLGREVAMLQDGWMGEGIHHVRFNATGLPSGMYVYQLRSGEHSAVRRMLLMK